MNIVQQDFVDAIAYYIQSGRQALFVDTSEITRAEQGVNQAAEDISLTRAARVEKLQKRLNELEERAEKFRSEGRARAAAGVVELQSRIQQHLSTLQAAEDSGTPENNQPMGFVTWDINNGFTDAPQITNPIKALQRVAEGMEGNVACVFRNFHIFLIDPAVAQEWQLLVDRGMLSNSDYMRPIIIVGTNVEMPKMLQATTTVVDFPLPSEDELANVFDYVQAGVRQSDLSKAQCTEEQRQKIISSLRGLKSNEAGDVLALCVVKHGGFAEEGLLETIEDEKAKLLKRTAGLTYVHKQKIASADEVGGFDVIKNWIAQRGVCFTAQAREHMIDPLKGLVLIGPPGTGKSLFGKVVARTLEQPLVIADISSVFGSLVGESEKRMREMLQTIDAMEQCVVLIDEADKVWGGANDSTGDSGVTRRIFGSFLTWLQEKESQAFVIMTINRINGIPPEFLRKGRFDEIFYTDLPIEGERKAIFDIHLRKRGIEDPSSVCSEEEWHELVDQTDGFVGSEIEDVVKSARLASFTARNVGVPNFEELLLAIKETVTLSVLDKENIESIRKFCAERARPVSSSTRQAVSSGGRQRSRGVNLS